jgi:vesicle coat complex subunit
LEELLKKIFADVFVHRYRDVFEDIRALCLESLGHWIESLPSMFLEDNYLKYLGWCLNDKAVPVRKQAISSIHNLYNVLDKRDVAKLQLFHERFKPRFSSMSLDNESSICAESVNLMTVLVKLEMLDEKDGANLPSFIWDESEEVRAAACAFVKEDQR